MRSIIGDMEYRQTDGKTRRVHKQYVDVVARILAGGQVVPVTVCWVDGRCFTIDEIVSTTGFGLTVHGIRTATYKVRFGGHATELYLEDQTRERPDGLVGVGIRPYARGRAPWVRTYGIRVQ